MRHFLFQVHIVILPTIILAAPAPAVAAQESCKLAAMGVGTVSGVRDGRTLQLRDGRELRLAAIEVGDEGRAALQSLVDGHELRLERLGAERDRYGRLVALVYLDNNGPSVQQSMLEQGHARVSARVGNKACADMLLNAERTARAAHRGLWADPNFAPLRSQDAGRIAAARGQFALVEGKVLSVRENGATTYLNFGRRWTRDFTATIPKRVRREFSAAGIDPKQLEGHPVRVRGWIEERSGPVMEVVAPEQIELTQ
ncbi:MAG TPA: thermonuclease family protein [Pseudolabrys sp.]|nr:thermonuclease family protein [Pseudolabrys sp.]